MPPKVASLLSITTQPATTITHTAIIDHIAELCGFAKEYTVMQIVAQGNAGQKYPMLPRLQ
jgi:hypothetical protein